MISVKTTSSSIKVFKNDTKILRIFLNDYNGVRKVSFDDDTLEVVFGDSKRRVYSLVDGEMMYETGTNLSKESKDDKKLRKMRYLSRLANEKRAS